MPRSRTITLLWASLIGMGVALLYPQTPVWAQSPEAAAGLQLMAQFQCNRCHEGTRSARRLARAALRPLSRGDSARYLLHRTGHAQDLAKPSGQPQCRTVSHGCGQPTTATVDRVFPASLPPFLGEDSLRRRASAGADTKQAQQIATALVPREAQGTPPAPGNPTSGRLLLDHLGCGACHQFTGVPPLRNTTAGPAIRN